MNIEMPDFVKVWVAKEPIGYIKSRRNPRLKPEFDFDVLFNGTGEEFRVWKPHSWAGRVIFRMRFWEGGCGINPFEATGVLYMGRIELGAMEAGNFSNFGKGVY